MGSSPSHERSPTLELLVLFALVFAAQTLLRILAAPLQTFLFVLGPSFLVKPWTIVTNVYAHANLGHLLSNAVALALVGFVLERHTTRERFHLFFAASGAIAGLAEVLLDGAIAAVLPWAHATAVLGASGAVFALYGYVLSGNAVSEELLRGLNVSRNAQLAVFVGLALVVTLATGSPGVALVAHFTGLLVGLVAGRLHLLETRSPRAA